MNISEYIKTYLQLLFKTSLFLGLTCLTLLGEVKLLDIIDGYYNGNMAKTLLTFGAIIAILGTLVQTHFVTKNKI